MIELIGIRKRYKVGASELWALGGVVHTFLKGWSSVGVTIKKGLGIVPNTWGLSFKTLTLFPNLQSMKMWKFLC